MPMHVSSPGTCLHIINLLSQWTRAKFLKRFFSCYVFITDVPRFVYLREFVKPVRILRKFNDASVDLNVGLQWSKLIGQRAKSVAVPFYFDRYEWDCKFLELSNLV